MLNRMGFGKQPSDIEVVEDKEQNYEYVDFSNFGIQSINYMSGGILYKYLERDNTDMSLYLYKTGILSDRKFKDKEVFIEQICSDILDYLDIPHAKYSIVKSKLSRSVKWLPQEIFISKSKWFYNENKETFLHANKIIPVELFRNPLAYYKILDLLPHIEESLNNMILFDFLVNNVDRHFKNFGFITNIETKEVKLAPLYDHGFCLGIDYDREFLNLILDEDEDDLDFDLEENLRDSDSCKSFASKNKNCLNLVESSNLLKGKSLDIILGIVDKYKDYLPADNIKFAKIILELRFKILKERYGC